MLKRPFTFGTSFPDLNLCIHINIRASAEIKSMMETLLEGDSVEVSIDEQLVFEQLDNDEKCHLESFVLRSYLKLIQQEKKEVLQLEQM